MYSCNIPVPGRVSRVASQLAPLLVGLETIREHHTLVVKRFGNRSPEEYGELEHRVRDALRGQPAFEARVVDIDTFEQPPTGLAPVVYLTVESPGLYALHNRLVEAFDPVPGLEGDEYNPHVTLGRGGDPEAVERLIETEIEPVEWTVTELILWDGTREEPASRVRLPA